MVSRKEALKKIFESTDMFPNGNPNPRRLDAPLALNVIIPMEEKMIDNETFEKYIGVNADFAVTEIQREYPDYKVASIPVGSFVTMDYDVNRICVWEMNGNVTHITQG